MTAVSTEMPRTIRQWLPDLPMVIWMIALTLLLGFLGGLDADGLVASFNGGFGRALGEFALILLPSFCLAAALARTQVSYAGGIAVGAAPLAGAGMICPDTAYAALSPTAGANRLHVAFGAYGGFKLLYPAGPLIVATGLGLPHDSLFAYGLALLIPVWIVGLLWAQYWQAPEAARTLGAKSRILTQAVSFAPFVILAGLLIAGAAVDFKASAVLDFMTQPKGALLTAALVALLCVAPTERRACLDSAVRRTGSLLLLIGAASAFGAVLTKFVPFGSLVPSEAGVFGAIGLFGLTALVKLVQGSSMATFAAVAPVAAPVVAGMDVAPAVAVFAVCAGSFVAVLPNDSYYWLVRRDALESDSEIRAMAILAGGATLQAFMALALIVVAVAIGA